AIALARICNVARLPEGAGWPKTYGVAILTGIGFTMSLFVGSLAFVPGSSEYAGMDRMGILTGSILAALIGYAVTAMASRKQALVQA
ncbi:MAG: Na+/H+ antiporter NhaA, partial [Pseudomonas sp.]